MNPMRVDSFPFRSHTSWVVLLVFGSSTLVPVFCVAQPLSSEDVDAAPAPETGPPAALSAIPRDPAAADALFKSALALLHEGEWEQACGKFKQSMQLDPSVSTGVKIARCYEHEGKVASAWHEYQKALELAYESQASATRQRELIVVIHSESAALEPRLPRLKVRVEPQPEGLVVSLNGAALAADLLGQSLPVDPGEQRVEAQAPGYQRAAETVELKERQSTTVQFALALIEEAAPVAPPPVPPQPASPNRSSASSGAALSDVPEAPPLQPSQSGWGQHETGLLIGALGLAALGGAGYFAYSMMDKVDQSNKYCDGISCEQEGIDLRNDANRDQTIAIVSASAGAIALGLAITLDALAPPESAGITGEGSSVRFALGPGSMSASGRF